MTDPALAFEGVTKRFGATVVLRDLDLAIEPGECVGLLGPNGAGKTTLLRLATGGLIPSGGSVRCLGTIPHQASTRLQRRCSYLPAEAGLDPARTGRQVLDLWMAPFGRDRSPVFETLVSAYPLPLDQRIGTWSAGMKQKLLLLLSLGVDAELFVLDEPERALDPTARWHLRQSVRALHAHGRTLLVSTHDLSTVESFADRSVFLSRGQRVADAQVAAIRDDLRSELRLRLTPDAELPSGVTFSERRPDGWIIVRTETPALEWLPQLDADQVLGLEYGASDLSAIYRHIEGLSTTAEQQPTGAAE